MLKSTVTRLFGLFSGLPLSVAHGQELDLSAFKLTFSDEFNGDTLDTTKWQAMEMPRQASCRWVNSLATVSDSALHLGIRLSDDPVLRYDCAAVQTRKDYDLKQTMFAQRYGYFEARAKLPKNMKSDYWAAFWMMCGNVNSADMRTGIETDNHCVKGTNLATGEKGTPLDFISFHAKGSPKQADGHVRMGISSHLINGQVMSIVVDEDASARTASGLIGVQVHVGPPMKIEYRHFLLKALPPVANKPSAGTN